MANILPRFEPGHAITQTASAAIIGGRLVRITGNRRVAHAGAAAVDVYGVALNDAAAEAELGVQREGIFELTAVGAIAAGAQVIAAADGRVATRGAAAAEQVVGIAQEAIADGGRGEVALQLT